MCQDREAKTKSFQTHKEQKTIKQGWERKWREKLSFHLAYMNCKQ